MTPLERARLLLAKARDDESAIGEFISSQRISDEIIGFHAQQAAEKLLKSVLMANEIPYRKTHDLLELLNLMLDNDLTVPEAFMGVRVLSPFAVEFRYDFLPPEREHALDRDAILILILQLRAWVEQELERGSEKAGARQLGNEQEPDEKEG